MSPRYCFEDFETGSTMTYGPAPVSRDDIVGFAREYDAQAFHLDEEAAKSTFVGTLIASGWQTCGFLPAAGSFYIYTGNKKF